MCVYYSKYPREKPWCARYRDVTINKRITLGHYETKDEAQRAYEAHVLMMKECGAVNQKYESRRLQIQEGYATASQIADMHGIHLNISRLLGKTDIKKMLYRDIYVYHVDSAKAYIQQNMPLIVAKVEKERKRQKKEGWPVAKGDVRETPPYFSLPPLDAFKKVAKEIRDSSPWR
jgi:hypothetical protein